jgi:hypothetical protein
VAHGHCHGGPQAPVRWRGGAVTRPRKLAIPGGQQARLTEQKQRHED